jgi:hypothetical protein
MCVYIYIYIYGTHIPFVLIVLVLVFALVLVWYGEILPSLIRLGSIVSIPANLSQTYLSPKQRAAQLGRSGSRVDHGCS